MVKKGSASSKKKNISKPKGAEAKKIAADKIPKSPEVADTEAVKTAEDTRKKPTPASEKLSLKELISKKFDAPIPEKLFSVPHNEAYHESFTAPPFVSTTDKDEIRRIGNLLFLKFDIGTFPMKMPKKPVTVRELLALKFEEWKPEKLFSVPCDEAYFEGIVPPPFVSGADETETKRIRNLLFSKFDIAEFPMKMPEPPRPKLSVRELLALKFEEWQPEKLFSVPCDQAYFESIVPPPFVSGADESETKRVRGLLFLKFDIAAFPMKMPEPPPPPKAVPQPVVPKAEPQPVIPKAKPEPTYRPAVKRYDPGNQASVSYTPPPSTPGKSTEKGSEPMEKTMKYFIAALVAVFVLIIGASFSNVSDHYLECEDNTLVVWKGIFAPMGRQPLIALPGAKCPAQIKDVYTKEEVCPLIFSYFVTKADALLESEGIPDFVRIRSYLNTAMDYGVSDENRKIAQSRLNGIDLVVLIYKADILISKGDSKAAMGYLEKASKLKLDPNQMAMVSQRIEVTKAMKDNAGSPKVQTAPIPAPKEKSAEPEKPAKQDLESAIRKVLEEK